MKPRILILEDNPVRHRLFREKFGLHVVIVEAASEAIKLLADKTWDTLFLDHDLGEHGKYAGVPVGTGYEVACWLERHPSHTPGQVIIHSLNTVGSKRIKAAIPQAILAPRIWMPDKGG